MMIVSVALEALTVSLVAPVSSLVFRAADPGAALPPWLPPWLASLSRLEMILSLVLGGVVFMVLKNIFVAFESLNQFRFNARIKQSISSRLLSKYLHAPYAFHLHRNSGQLIRNVISEVHELEARTLIPWMILLAEGSISAGLIIVLLCINPLGTLSVASLLALAGISYFLITRGRLQRHARARLRAEEQRIRLVQQFLGAIKEVKLLGLEDSSLLQFQSHNRASANALAAEAFFRQAPRLILEIVAISSVLLVVMVSFLRGESTEALLASLAVLAAGAFRLLPAANRIISAISSIQFGSVALQNISQELHDTEVPDGTQQQLPRKGATSFAKEIRIRHLSFTYPGSETPVLRDVSLSIPRNAFVALIGESGSGKSTLVDLILGLLEPDSGEISVDDHPVHQSLRQWQDKLAYVPQHIYLGDLSIRENVAFGVPREQIDEERVWEVLRLAHLDSFVASLPARLDTMVGERGVRLSGGQCQRIGIARALYREPEVIVFDEATSALDDESQAKVMEAIRDLKGSRTIIMISHRLSTIENCDLVYQIDAGRCRCLSKAVS